MYCCELNSFGLYQQSRKSLLKIKLKTFDFSSSLPSNPKPSVGILLYLSALGSNAGSLGKDRCKRAGRKPIGKGSSLVLSGWQRLSSPRRVAPLTFLSY